MNHPNPANFLHSLALFMAAGAGSLVYGRGAGRQLWVWEALEKFSAFPHSVLLTFGGPGQAWDLQPRCSIQCTTYGEIAAAAARAAALYATLLDGQGYPTRMLVIDAFTTAWDDDAEAWTADGAYTLVSVDPTDRPGLTNPGDAPARAEVVFNFDVGFFWEPAS